MKGLVYVMISLSCLSLGLSLMTKYVCCGGKSPGMIAGVGPAGYLNATVVLLLLGANFALLELLKKK